MIEENDSVVIASETTVLNFARHIKVKGTLTVITSALQVTAHLHNPLRMLLAIEYLYAWLKGRYQCLLR
ncbi:hypothetical protein [Albibacterium bauzanense]|uniref:hypothetical protein n=1 Tax=Albibacterium bauzanense TaxID=653929 RepID=UPI0016275FCF|nr:hypothetical protein [Albibacterium bauzanense]